MASARLEGRQAKKGFEMAAKKRRTTSTRARSRSRGNNQVLKMAASTVLGGASGALVGGLLVRAGVKPTTAAVGVAVAGTVGASTLKGRGRLASGGAAAAGAGQLALSWLTAQSKPAAVAAPTAAKKTKRNAGPADIEAAFARAREQLEIEDEAAAYADGYDVVDVDQEDLAA